MKRFRLKDGAFYGDRVGNLRGPLRLNDSAFGKDNDYFTCDQSKQSWRRNGEVITTGVIFFGQHVSHPEDLIKKVKRRK